MKSHQIVTFCVLTLALSACSQAQEVVEPVKMTSTSTEAPQATLTITLAPSATIPAPTDTATPEPTATSKPEMGSTKTREKDGMVMVFVPKGPFIMGSNKHYKAEIPEHTVTLEAYWIDKTEVTNAMFSIFVADTGYQTVAEKNGASFAIYQDTKAFSSKTGANWQHPQGKESSLEGIENHPVVHMMWEDAHAYCEWAGGRLPTEEEWEKAARGEDGRFFPWGNDPLDGTRANIADKNFPEGIKSIDDGYKFTAPVGTYPLGASPYGALDMNGNASEWVEDLFHEYPGGDKSIMKGNNKDFHVVRGYSWYSTSKIVHASGRSAADPFWEPKSDSGFRCAASE